MSLRPSHMKLLAKALPSLALTLVIGLLSSCGAPSGNTMTVLHTRGYQQNHGPFDHNGNYVESWADKAPKRNYVTREQYAKLGKKAKKRISTPTPPPTPRYVAITPKPAPVQARVRPTSYAKPKVASRPKTTSRPKPSSRPKPKSVKVKPKAKPPIVHRVKRGDTLYGLSRKYKTSIGGIQRANKLNSTHIGIGDRLIIPRK